MLNHDLPERNPVSQFHPALVLLLKSTLQIHTVKYNDCQAPDIFKKRPGDQYREFPELEKPVPPQEEMGPHFTDLHRQHSPAQPPRRQKELYERVRG